ncbi:hypothetical protein [Ornithinimicrobium cryptoxanthini]|uniref:Uncharacterized protein n=1 Tax=Ornithinimicrobium cryptoxanthini TaxID=2934161 RepID=A0ABY4YFG5_9MICO|nr:hypothetical protein [Ornithinimicrobium cryptoxanthini]USQ75093.1 hypothetical protein NF557_10595 [Ornithinimicrobium cryptoxanthini]
MLSQRQRSVLTFGAAMLLLLGAVLLPFALLLPRVEPGAATVEGPPITLPAPGLLGSSVMVYSSAEGADDRDLGCEVLDESGDPVSGVPLNGIAGALTDPVEVDGTTFYGAFEASGWPEGGTIECAEEAQFALGDVSLFGGLTEVVRAVALGAAGLSLLLGGVALLVLRAPPAGRS